MTRISKCILFSTGVVKEYFPVDGVLMEIVLHVNQSLIVHLTSISIVSLFM